MALFELKTKAGNISLAQLYGGGPYETIPVTKMLAMGTTDWMSEQPAAIPPARLSSS